MYPYQPCLLALSLYAWAFDKRKIGMLFPLVVLFLSEWEIFFTNLSIYPSALLLVLFLLRKPSTDNWAETLTASLLGGLMCWKAADAWPLVPGSTLLYGACMALIVTVVCRKRADRLLAFALGGLLFELFFCLREYMLFSYCRLRLGSRNALDLSAASICIYSVMEHVQRFTFQRRAHAPSI